MVSFSPDSLDRYREVANRAVIKARALRDDPELRSIQSWLRQRLERGRTSFTAQSGQVFRCPDPYLEEKGEQLLGAALPAVPEDFVWFDPRERQESVQLAFSRLLQVLHVNVASANTFLPKDVDALLEERVGRIQGGAPEGGPAIMHDVLPLIFSLVTDVLIFLAALAAPWRDEDYGRPLDNLARIAAEHPTLGGEFFRRLESFLDPRKIPESFRLLQDHAVTFGGSDYILVLEPPRSDRDHRVRTLMEFLVNAKVAEVFRPLLAGGKTPGAWARVLEAKGLPETAEFRLYRLKPGLLQALAGEIFLSQMWLTPGAADEEDAVSAGRET